MRSDRYFRNGIKMHIIANPDVVPHRQIPGVSYTHARTDENAFSDLRTKQDKCEPPPSEHVLRRGQHKDRLEQPPQLCAPGGAPARSASKTGQILKSPSFHRDRPTHFD